MVQSSESSLMPRFYQFSYLLKSKEYVHRDKSRDTNIYVIKGPDNSSLICF